METGFEYPVTHYPMCNDRCVGQSHWMDNTDVVERDLPPLIEQPSDDGWAKYERLTPPDKG